VKVARDAWPPPFYSTIEPEVVHSGPAPFLPRGMFQLSLKIRELEGCAVDALKSGVNQEAAERQRESARESARENKRKEGREKNASPAHWR